MKHIKYVMGLVLILIIGYWFYTSQTCPRVIVKSREERFETSYIVTDENKNEIIITTYQTELNKGILHLRSRSELPLKQQINYLSKILARILKEENKEEFHTLFAGRLIYAFGPNNSQMSQRLSLAAFQSPLWDKAAGKAVSGYDHIAVKNIANDAMIYPELKEMFKKHGLDIKVSGFEKILIGVPQKIPFGDSLIKKGVRSADKLPYDGLTWFRLTLMKNF